ncbi:MAG: Abi family protein [Chitinophagaceae bacterium]|nr:Abi family protein [Chitinophagaceae bacterium]
MNYTKPPISIADQIAKLKARGLTINDEAKATSYLSNISYYRLRAYTYPFQDNKNSLHPFIVRVTFDEIINLYVFDRKFRLLLFDAIEKIEISMRTEIIYQWALSNGSHWHLDAALYRNPVQFAKNYTRLSEEIKRSEETFIKHYRQKYTNPTDPPSWMSLEVTSFGLLSLIFSNLKKGPEKIAVTKYYGLNDISVLESWMHSLSNIRNVCAHHSRLWNRRLTAHIKLPTNTKFTFVKHKNILPYKVYAAVCSIQYLLNIISPGCGFKDRLLSLMKNCPLAQEKEMGFPPDWQNEPLWKN